MLKKSFFFILMILGVSFAIAQPGGGIPGGGGDVGTGDPPPVGAVPVDGGLALILAAGVGYGAKKAYDYRKNKVKSEK